MADRTPLSQITGNITRDPQTKDTSKGEVVNFGLAVNDGYGEDKNTTFYDVAVWNEGLQASVLAKGSGVQRGASVTVEGPVRQNGQYNPSINAVRIALNEWLDRTARKPQPATDDSDDF